MSPTSRRVGLTVGVLLAGIGLWSALGPSVDQMVLGIDWVRGAGALGALIFAAAYVVATVFAVPASWLMGAAGFLYGPVWGLALASLLSTVSGTVAFAIARLGFRGRITPTGRWAAIDRAVVDSGLGLMVLLRLPPLSPYNIVNYGMGLTGIRWRDFVLGTWLGGLVPIALWSIVGASVSDIGDLLSGENTGPVWVRVVGLVLTVGVTLLVTTFARRALNRAVDSQAVPS